jgi:hypothetical protein
MGESQFDAWSTLVEHDVQQYTSGRFFFSSIFPHLAPYQFLEIDPNHSICRVSTWALEEARRRLEAEGILPDPEQVKKD